MHTKMFFAVMALTFAVATSNAQESNDSSTAESPTAEKQRPAGNRNNEQMRQRRESMTDEQRAAARERWQGMSDAERQAARDKRAARGNGKGGKGGKGGAGGQRGGKGNGERPPKTNNDAA